MSKVIYTVYSVPPDDKILEWVPCILDEDNILWLAYANERRGVTGFKRRQDARNAITRTKRFIKRKKMTFWSGKYKIVPVKF